MYEFHISDGKIEINYEERYMIFKTEQGLGQLKPLDLKIDTVITNVDIWYLTIKNLLRGRFDYKAEFRVPKEDFHMELMPFDFSGTAVLKVIHETKNQGYIFKIQRPVLFAFLSMFKEIDKKVLVQDLIAEKKNGMTYLDGIFLPFQERKALEFLIEDFLTYKIARFHRLDWVYGRLDFDRRKIRLFEKDENEKLHLKKEIGVDVDSITKLSMVL